MAYLDQRSGINQRAVIATTVALLEGAAILALVNGLAAHFLPPPPEHRLQSQTTTMPLPPQPMPKTEQPKPQKPSVQKDRQTETRTTPAAEETPDIGQVTDTDGDLSVGTEPDVTVTPPRPPAYTPHAARPRGNPASWVGQDDYPTSDLRAGHQGSVRFKLTIGSNGAVESCAVTESSGYRGLDEAACKYISSRARFEPATDGDGRQVTGTYSNRIRWMIPKD